MVFCYQYGNAIVKDLNPTGGVPSITTAIYGTVIKYNPTTNTWTAQQDSTVAGTVVSATDTTRWGTTWHVVVHLPDSLFEHKADVDDSIIAYLTRAPADSIYIVGISVSDIANGSNGFLTKPATDDSIIAYLTRAPVDSIYIVGISVLDIVNGSNGFVTKAAAKDTVLAGIKRASLANLSDVDTTGIADNYVLSYIKATNKFDFAAAGAGGGDMMAAAFDDSMGNYSITPSTIGTLQTKAATDDSIIAYITRAPLDSTYLVGISVLDIINGSNGFVTKAAAKDTVLAGIKRASLANLADVDTTGIADNYVLSYIKATNTFDFAAAGAGGGDMMVADVEDSVEAELVRGSVIIGASDANPGRIDLYGGGTSEDDAVIYLYNNSDNDATIDWWKIRPYQTQLHIAPDSDTDRFIFRSNGIFESVSLVMSKVKADTSQYSFLAQRLGTTVASIDTNGVAYFASAAFDSGHVKNASLSIADIANGSNGFSLKTGDAAIVTTGTVATGTWASNITLGANESINLGTPTALTTGQYVGTVSTLTAGYTTAVGDIVYFNTTSELQPADADSARSTKAKLVIALEVKTDGQACLVLEKGYICLTAYALGDSIGGPVYLSSTAKIPTVVIPGTGKFLRTIGNAITDDLLFFDPDVIWGEVQ